MEERISFRVYKYLSGSPKALSSGSGKIESASNRTQGRVHTGSTFVPSGTRHGTVTRRDRTETLPTDRTLGKEVHDETISNYYPGVTSTTLLSSRHSNRRPGVVDTQATRVYVEEKTPRERM